MKGVRRKHCEMLEIALAPPAVAGREIQQRRRAFFKAAAKCRHHSNGPPRPSHQRRFDEVMAEDVASERFPAMKFRQARILREGAYANDRIVTPIVAFGSMPPGDACGDQRAVEPA